MQKTCSAR